MANLGLVFMLSAGLLGSPSLKSGELRVNFGSEQRINDKSLELMVSESDLGSLRQIVKDKVHEKYPNIHVFGTYLDSVEDVIRKYFYSENVLAPVDSTKHRFGLKVPENFFVDSMDVFMNIAKNERKLRVYQRYNAQEILLFESNIVVGAESSEYFQDHKKNFETPEGLFFIKRFVKDPWWYPPLEWWHHDDPVGPGKDNPFGEWMAELFREGENLKDDYEFMPGGQDEKIRLHGTYDEKWMYPALRSSHGCIRLERPSADELFNGLLYYLPNKEPKETGRGIIYPLKKPIWFIILGNNHFVENR